MDEIQKIILSIDLSDNTDITNSVTKNSYIINNPDTFFILTVLGIKLTGLSRR